MKKILAMTLLVIFISGCTDTYLGRYLIWQWADMGDYELFPSEPLQKSSNPIEFNRNIHSQLFGNFKKGSIAGFEKYIEEQKTRSLIVLHNNEVVYENYFNGYKEDSINRAFSASKSVVALLIGIALEEGKFLSIDDQVEQYMPEKPAFKSFTIRQGLNLLSGLDLTQGESPWDDSSLAYYVPDQRTRVLNLETRAAPGEEFNYTDSVTSILGIALEKQYQKSIAQIAQEKLWEPLGMQYDGSWSQFSEGNITQAASGLNARSIDYAKIGQLFLNDGEWYGKQIVPKEWVDYIKVSFNDASVLRDVRGESVHYGAHWWHIERPNKALAQFAAGHLGQYIMVYEDLNIVIVRNGDDWGEADWFTLMAEMAEHTHRVIN